MPKAAKKISQALVSFSICFMLLLVEFMNFPTQGQATAPGETSVAEAIIHAVPRSSFFLISGTEKLWADLWADPQDTPSWLQGAFLALTSACSACPACHRDQKQLCSAPKLAIVTLPG